MRRGSVLRGMIGVVALVAQTEVRAAEKPLAERVGGRGKRSENRITV